MHYTLALLFSLLQLLSVGTAAPLSADVVKMKSKVKWMAELLVARLDRDFQFQQVPATHTTTTDAVDGASSVVTILEGYNSLISDSLDGVPQVKADISSLAGYLSQWRQGHCSEQRPKPSVPGHLQGLQIHKDFIHTVSMQALVGVREFLNVLLKNLDQLEIC